MPGCGQYLELYPIWSIRPRQSIRCVAPRARPTIVGPHHLRPASSRRLRPWRNTMRRMELPARRTGAVPPDRISLQGSGFRCDGSAGGGTLARTPVRHDGGGRPRRSLFGGGWWSLRFSSCACCPPGVMSANVMTAAYAGLRSARDGECFAFRHARAWTRASTRKRRWLGTSLPVGLWERCCPDGTEVPAPGAVAVRPLPPGHVSDCHQTAARPGVPYSRCKDPAPGCGAECGIEW